MFSVKIWVVSILGFVGQMIPVATAQLGCCSEKIPIDNV